MRTLLIALAGLALAGCNNAQQTSAPEAAATMPAKTVDAEPTAVQLETFGALTDFVGKSFEGSPVDGSTEIDFDIQKWEWALGGTAILIRHALGNGSYGGDTYVYKDAKTQQLVYVYITNAGFRTEGVIEVKEDGSYTAEEAVEGHPTITRVRSTSKLNEDGSSSMTSEYLDGDEWTPGHAFTYVPTTKPLPKLKAPEPK